MGITCETLARFQNVMAETDYWMGLSLNRHNFHFGIDFLLEHSLNCHQCA